MIRMERFVQRLDKAKEVIDNALAKNIIVFDTGKNNSKIFKLNSNSK